MTISDILNKYKVNSINELYDSFFNNDQELMKSGEWDYENKSSLVNKIKSDVESLSENNLEYLLGKILWLWYHHATSCAIHKYKDKEKAKHFIELALKYKPKDSKNSITYLLYLLLNDRFEEAKEHVNDGIEMDYERETAEYILNEYKSGWFA